MARGLAEAADQALYSDGQWYKASKILGYHMKPNPAALLNVLINEHRAHGHNNDQPVVMSRAHVLQVTSMDKRAQATAITELKSRGLIRTYLDRANNRYFVINWQAIIELCESTEIQYAATSCSTKRLMPAQSDLSDPVQKEPSAGAKCSDGGIQKEQRGDTKRAEGSDHSSTPYPYKEVEEERRTVSAKPTVRANGFFEDDFAENQRKEDYADHAARQLADSLLSKRKLLRNPSLAKWAKSLRTAMPQVDDGPHHLRFKKVMDWYCENIGGDYIPQAYSANSFVDKFPQIEAAMMRAGHIKEDKCKAQARRIREKFERDRAAERLATV